MAIFSKKNEASAKPQAKAAAKPKAPAAPSMKDLYEAAPAKANPASGASVAAKPARKPGNQAWRVLVKPLISEKSAAQAHVGKYFFAVAPGANKVEIAKAVYEIYKIQPTKVNIINSEGKKVSRGRVHGQRKDWKKAIVTLPKGQSLDLYEGV